MTGICFLSASLLLLTDNPVGSEAFPSDTPVLRTGATVSWLTEGAFASDPDLVSQSMDRRGRCNLLNGRVGGGGGVDLGAYGKWGNGGVSYGSFVIDLKSPRVVEKVTVWSAETKAIRGIDRFAVALSSDGRQFAEVGVCVVGTERPDLPAKPIVTVPFDCVLSHPAVARYVRVVVSRHPGVHQMILGEVAVWGREVGLAHAKKTFSLEEGRPTVDFMIDGWSSGAATLDWRAFGVTGDVRKWRVYAAEKPFVRTDAPGVTFLGEVGAMTREYAVYPLKPGVTRHYAVSAVYDAGEMVRVKSRPHAPIGPLQVTRFRDMLGMNFFWGGGGAQGTKVRNENYVIAADFLADSPFRKIRWWKIPEWAAKEYTARRIEVSNFQGEPELCSKYGYYLHGIGNEPDHTPTTPEQLVEDYRKIRESWRKAGAEHRFYGPVTCLYGGSLDYFKRFVLAGGDKYVDSYNFHTYCGKTADYEYPKGYPYGSPEALVGMVEKINAFLREHHAEKPLSSSEWGISDTRTANPHADDMTPMKKAQLMVRGCILHHVLGFCRLFVYSFYDEGTDENYSEHSFGIVTRDLQKKPSYHALKVMGDAIGDALVERKMSGLGDGDFGYVFRNVDKPGFVSVVWNGARPRRGVFRTRPGEVTVVDLLGTRRTLRTKEDGTFQARFDASVRYFSCAAPVDVVSTSDAEAADERDGCVRVCASADRMVRLRGEKTRLSFSLSNASDRDVVLRTVLTDFRGTVVACRDVSVAAHGKSVCAFDVSGSRLALDCLTLAADYELGGESRRETCSVWVRELMERTGKTNVIKARFANFDRDVWIVSTDALEISIDPVQGGQVLDVIDKRTRKGQITCDYARLPTISSAMYDYCLWDWLRCYPAADGKPPMPGYNRKTFFRASPTGRGVRLVSGTGSASFAKTVELSGDRMRWSIAVTNRGSSVMRCQWNIHPEYLPGGSADTYRDRMVIPTAKGEYTPTFWSGLGERQVGDVAAGWWRMEDPVDRYAICQTYDLSRFEKPKLWFGVGAWNVEMYSRLMDLKPGEGFSLELDWRFLASADFGNKAW